MCADMIQAGHIKPAENRQSGSHTDYGKTEYDRADTEGKQIIDDKMIVKSIIKDRLKGSDKNEKRGNYNGIDSYCNLQHSVHPDQCQRVLDSIYCPSGKITPQSQAAHENSKNDGDCKWRTADNLHSHSHPQHFINQA